jgi:hypothetical protein
VALSVRLRSQYQMKLDLAENLLQIEVLYFQFLGQVLAIRLFHLLLKCHFQLLIFCQKECSVYKNGDNLSKYDSRLDVSMSGCFAKMIESKLPSRFGDLDNCLKNVALSIIISLFVYSCP